MGNTIIAKNLIKTSVEIDRNGRIVSERKSETLADEKKQKQAERARRLGMRAPQ